MSSTTDSVLAGGLSSVAGAVIALAIVLGRTRERMARIEEWIRQFELKEKR